MNIATIIEEKVDGEEVGEDGTVSKFVLSLLRHVLLVLLYYVCHPINPRTTAYLALMTSTYRLGQIGQSLFDTVRDYTATRQQK